MYHPAFIGFNGSPIQSFQVNGAQAYALEKVGHAYKMGRHSLLNTATCQRRWEETKVDGGIRFNGGSVAIHIFDRNFIARVGSSGEGRGYLFIGRIRRSACQRCRQNNPTDSPNGVKFEMFVFDALPLAKNPVIIEAARADDFIL